MINHFGIELSGIFGHVLRKEGRCGVIGVEITVIGQWPHLHNKEAQGGES